MNKRVIVLLTVFFVLVFYFFVFSYRSPIKDLIFPAIYYKTAREILPNPEPSLNTHEFLLKTGANVNAALELEGEGEYKIRKYKNKQLIEERVIKRSNVLSVSIRQQALAVSSSEIIAKRLYPEMRFFRFKNYTVFTDSGYSSISPTIGKLKKLFQDIYIAFPEIVNNKGRDNRVCVVAFSKSEDYKNLVERINPGAIESVGCYSPDHNLLFVNADSSIRARGSNSGDIVRHEGAHQIYYSFGLHFGYGIDRLWFVEGLATYSEPIRFGSIVSHYQNKFKIAQSNNNDIPIKKLLNTQRVSDKSAELFYAQSWSLTYFLMKRYKDEFYNYMRYVKKHPIFSRIKGDVSLLERFVGKSINEIDSEYKEFHNKN